MRNGGRVGLKLTKTPSFLSSLNQLSSYNNKRMKRPDSISTSDDGYSLSGSPDNKLKAANFPALSLQIGSWKVILYLPNSYMHAYYDFSHAHSMG